MLIIKGFGVRPCLTIIERSDFMLIDTHAHLDFDEYKDNFEDVLKQAQEAGVEKIIIPGVTIKDSQRVVDLIEKYDCLYGAIGVHPSEAKTWDENSYEILKNFAKHEKIVAIGEIGLDYYWDKTFNDVQQVVLKEQIKLAKKLKKPVIIHDREAHSDVFNILKETNANEVGVVMHCFSGSLEFAMECVNLGFYIALGGPVTFKNAKKPKEVASKIPLDKLLLETDCPFLTPHPYRGQVNYPHYIKLVAEEIATLRGVSYDEIASQTTKNAEKLFQLN